MKTNARGKKQRNETLENELLKAIAALEEIVMAEEPEDWEDEEEADEKLPSTNSSLEKAKDKIREKLLANDGELTSDDLHRKVRGDRMGQAMFNRAIQSLEDNQEIEIIKKERQK